MVTIPNVGALSLITVMRDELLDTGELKLFKNNITPSIVSILADFEEADFSGYADYPIAAWGAPYINLADQAEVDAPSNQWSHNGGAVGNQVYGWYYLAPSGALLAAERFADGPYPMVEVTDAIALLPRFALQSQP